MILDSAHLEDTISAVSTALGRSGIGVIRLSGPESLPITQQLFHPRGKQPLSPNLARLGDVRDPHSGDLIDVAMVTFFKGPKSYTGEDVVEISCHGSPVILNRLLELSTGLGARIAQPGEFTLRAFCNRRIDLTQAEAVSDLINAQTNYQAKVAARQLGGSLSKQFQPMKDQLAELIVQLETAVEFVEDDVEPDELNRLAAKLNHLLTQLSQIERSFGFGRVVREGIQLAIVGRPNVGKSSIFNKLLQKDRAIVTAFPGTTRDTLRDVFSVEGIPVHLIDTAGIRRSADMVESMGIERSRTAIADADIVLVVLDQSEDLAADDLLILEETESVRRLIIFNKSDLPSGLPTGRIDSLTSGSVWVRVSALTGEGVDVLKRKVVEIVTSGSWLGLEDAILTNARHHDLVVRMIGALRESAVALEEKQYEEVILVGLHDALRIVGEITGEMTIEDILDRIFSTFCIGK